ncbi:alpha/beta fold hydrolase [Camelimonas abortus]|uniref:Alpha/beta fold hydrolase n=1 Tax=Camelimonas abortus TaxID=1017184 RepID=A0ABV7LD01_9HYPH
MQHFSSDGVDIAYIDLPAPEGSAGDPVLLVHGFASNHSVNWIYPGWTTTLNRAGYRVIALDNRGHGQSQKFYDPACYSPRLMARDCLNLLDHLGLARADVMGYSMGARIAACLASERPDRVRSVVLGGLGIRLVDGAGLPAGIADALEAPDATQLTDPQQKMFRNFAEQTRSDLKALAACMRGARQSLSRDEVQQIGVPALIAVGTRDDIAGSPHELAALMPNAEAIDIPGRDHNLAVGDRVFKQETLAFLARRP